MPKALIVDLVGFFSVAFFLFIIIYVISGLAEQTVTQDDIVIFD